MSEETSSHRNPIALIIIAVIAGAALAALLFASPSGGGSGVQPSIDCVSTTAYQSYPCVFVEAVDFKAGVVTFEVGNQGGFNVTLYSASINGSASNAGFTGVVSMSLSDTKLTVNGAATFTAPLLPGAKAGDKISLEVVTTSDTYYIKNTTL